MDLQPRRSPSALKPRHPQTRPVGYDTNNGNAHAGGGLTPMRSLPTSPKLTPRHDTTPRVFNRRLPPSSTRASTDWWRYLRIPSRRHIRRWVRERYRDFGRHCARNQIRVLLIDSFVMTTLFYPALALHLQRNRPTFFSSLISSSADTSPPPPHSSASSRASSLFGVLADVFFPFPERLLEATTAEPFWADEAGSWTAHERPPMLASGAAWNPQLENRIDVLELLVGWTDVATVFERGEQEGTTSHSGRTQRDRRVLDLLHSEFQAWNNTGDVECVQQDDQCLVQPLSTVDGVTQYAAYLKRSTRDPQWTLTAMQGWSDLLSRVAAVDDANCAILSIDSPPTVFDVRVSHQDEDPMALAPRSAVIPLPIAALYVIALGYLFWLMVRDRETHSRFGLAFTGIVELAASSIMSFSLIGLFELRGGASTNDLSQPGVPWYILPFVVLVVGVENMSTLTRAVYAIPISRSVPDRIGYGMSNVGPRLFLTSLSDIAILTLIRLLIKLRPVEEFCTFASVLIFVDWFMIQTFYLTVLSIDCQRLELADLLRSKSGSIKKVINGSPPKDMTAPRRNDPAATPIEIATTVGSSSLKWGIERLWRARTTRGISLMLLLSSLTALYYYNETTQQGAGRGGDGGGFWQPSQTLPLRDPAQTTATLRAMHDAGSLGALLLHAIDSTASLAIARAPITKLIWPSEGYNISPASIVQYDLSLARPYLPRIRPVFQFIKIVIIPQCATAFLLWLLLLFLLKDTQLLDARRDRAESSKTTAAAATPLTSVVAAAEATPNLRLVLLPASETLDIRRAHILDPDRASVLVEHADHRMAIASAAAVQGLGEGSHLDGSNARAAWTHGEAIHRMVGRAVKEDALPDDTHVIQLLVHREEVWALLGDHSVVNIGPEAPIKHTSLPAGNIQLLSSADCIHALITNSSHISVAILGSDSKPKICMTAKISSPVVSASVVKYRNDYICLFALEDSSLQLFGPGNDDLLWSHHAASSRRCSVWAANSNDTCLRCDRPKSSSITVMYSAGDSVQLVKLSEDSVEVCRCNAGRALRPSVSSGDGNASRRFRASDLLTPSKTTADATPPTRLGSDTSPSKVNGSALQQTPPALREYWPTPLKALRGDWVVANNDTLVVVTKTASGGGWQVQTHDLNDGTEAQFIIRRQDLDRASLPASDFAAIAYSKITLFADPSHRTVGLLLGNRSALITLPSAQTPNSQDSLFLSPNLLTPMKAG